MTHSQAQLRRGLRCSDLPKRTTKGKEFADVPVVGRRHEHCSLNIFVVTFLSSVTRALRARIL